MRNRSNYFNQIETGHFMSKGIVPKVAENLVLNELTNMWLEPSFIGDLFLINRLIVQQEAVFQVYVRKLRAMNKGRQYSD